MNRNRGVGDYYARSAASSLNAPMVVAIPSNQLVQSEVSLQHGVGRRYAAMSPTTRRETCDDTQAGIRQERAGRRRWPCGHRSEHGRGRRRRFNVAVSATSAAGAGCSTCPGSATCSTGPAYSAGPGSATCATGPGSATCSADPACAAGSGSPGRACGAAAATDPAHSTDPAGPADPTHPGLIGITLAPSLALRQRRGAPNAWKLVRSRFHSVRPTGWTPRAINSRLRILLVAVVGRSSVSQT